MPHDTKEATTARAPKARRRSVRQCAVCRWYPHHSVCFSSSAFKSCPTLCPPSPRRQAAARATTAGTRRAGASRSAFLASNSLQARPGPAPTRTAGAARRQGEAHRGQPHPTRGLPLVLALVLVLGIRTARPTATTTTRPRRSRVTRKESRPSRAARTQAGGRCYRAARMPRLAPPAGRPALLGPSATVARGAPACCLRQSSLAGDRPRKPAWASLGPAPEPPRPAPPHPRRVTKA